MNTYDKKCPVCGQVNKNLYLDETEGWMECERCSRISRVNYVSKRIVPAICKMYAASTAVPLRQMG